MAISCRHSQPDRPLEANSRIDHICETPALDSNALDGILVNYSYTGRNLNGYEETVRVFSARDAYVWTSSKLPEGATLLATIFSGSERVATFPYFGHHNNRTLEYIICDKTFPAGSRVRWASIIDSAFERWEDVTNDFVTVENVSGSCAAGSPGDDLTYNFIKQDDAQNEIRMLNVARSQDLYTFPEFKSDALKACLTPYTSACVTSFTGYTGLQVQAPDERRAIAKAIENAVERDDPIDLIGHLLSIIRGRHERKGSNVIPSVDVTFNEAFFGGSAPVLPTDVRFSTCLPDGTPG